jgi:hypothetical protein
VNDGDSTIDVKYELKDEVDGVEITEVSEVKVKIG